MKLQGDFLPIGLLLLISFIVFAAETDHLALLSKKSERLINQQSMAKYLLYMYMFRTLYSTSILHQIDPPGQPTVMIGSDHYIHTCCPSVRPSTFQNRAKQKSNVQLARRWVWPSESLKTPVLFVFITNKEQDVHSLERGNNHRIWYLSYLKNKEFE